MATFYVQVIIENKHGISDPEAETILKDLIVKNKKSKITEIKTAKLLRFTIKEKDAKSAQKKIRELCDELRIYNPMVSKIKIKVSDD